MLILQTIIAFSSLQLEIVHVFLIFPHYLFLFLRKSGRVNFFTCDIATYCEEPFDNEI